MTDPQPANPVDDLAAWRGRSQGDRAAAYLGAELIALAQAGVGISLASRAPDGRPLVGLALACRHRGAGRLRVLLARTPNAALLEALRAGAPIAATFSRVQDHRSFQVKSGAAQVLPQHSDDLPEVGRQSAVFRDELVAAGFASEISGTYVAHDPADIVAVEFTPESAFVQTPGPGAGSALEP